MPISLLRRVLGKVSGTISGMPPKKRNKDACLFQLPKLECDARIDNMTAELSQVEEAIAKVHRQKLRSQTALMPNNGLMLQAVVVFELCQDTRWAVLYVTMQQRLNMHQVFR